MALAEIFVAFAGALALLALGLFLFRAAAYVQARTEMAWEEFDAAYDEPIEFISEPFPQLPPR